MNRLLTAIEKPVLAVLTSREFAIVLASFLFIDALILSIHVASVLLRNAGSQHALAQPFFNLGYDRGLGEIFGYVKLLACAILLASIWRVTRTHIFLAFVFLYLCALVDDAMSIHEQIGDVLQGLGYRKELGEAPVLIAPSLVTLAIFAREFQSTCKEHRILGFAYLGLFAALAFFAVFLDALHVPVIVEDGGELVTLSFHTAFTASLYFVFWTHR